ncbi:hypothetical protein [Plantibacter sp. ME-Dv--P-122b]|uniref:glycosyltransferase family 39 protein n=1 Tax=Plantibacter sp. ME-Dv--P-122b TaxID=3040300 RepID=UPI0025515275|nr:hypothetical protein [Plantibacter sp. ME-Dv--P-122b]
MSGDITGRVRTWRSSVGERLLVGDRYRFVYVVVAVAAAVMALSLTAGHSAALSPFDEWMYFDYLVKFPTQGYVHLGEPVGDVAMNWLACNGFQAFGNTVNACNVTPIDPAIFPFAGIQSAQLYTPVFFAPTWAVGTAVQAVTGLSLLEAARYTGTLWLIGTVIAVAAVLRQFRVPASAAIAVVLIFIASPFAYWTYTFVSTDAPGVLIGALSILLIERAARGRSNAWWLVGLFTLAMLIKAVNIIAIGLVVLYAVTRFIMRYRDRVVWRRPGAWLSALRGRGPLAMLAGPLVGAVLGVAAQLAWLRVVASSAVGAQVDMGQGRPMTSIDVIGQLWSFIPGIFATGSFEMAAVSRLYLPEPVLAPMLGWLCLAGVVGVVWLGRLRGVQRLVTGVTLVAALVAGPALAVMFTISVGEYVDLGARYGANLLPVILLSVALLCSGRTQRRVLLGFATALFSLSLVASWIVLVAS